MDSTSRRPVRRNRAARRGVSLIEGMTASMVLLIGLVGIFQGILVASRQNIMANHATRASGIASQARVALDTLGWARVIGTADRPGLLVGQKCNPSDEVRALAGGMETLEPTKGEKWRVSCIFDLDAYEKTAAPSVRLLPNYGASDLAHYRRILVVIDVEDEATGVNVNQVTVVVSWEELGKRRFVRQNFGFYDSGPFGNETYVEI
ncbi:hypothetical protein NR798_13430 [Archangium gephyra]|uniref:type IV pilus modification PilV family protein n=1 Tax=Archangium gephyra TaxID=48 RepID=UPI0035D46270